MPYSGPVSALSSVGKAQSGYFDIINAKGGVNWRNIKAHQSGRRLQPREDGRTYARADRVWQRARLILLAREHHERRDSQVRELHCSSKAARILRARTCYVRRPTSRTCNCRWCCRASKSIPVLVTTFQWSNCSSSDSTASDGVHVGEITGGKDLLWIAGTWPRQTPCSEDINLRLLPLKTGLFEREFLERANGRSC